VALDVWVLYDCSSVVVIEDVVDVVEDEQDANTNDVAMMKLLLSQLYLFSYILLLFNGLLADNQCLFSKILLNFKKVKAGLTTYPDYSQGSIHGRGLNHTSCSPTTKTYSTLNSLVRPALHQIIDISSSFVYFYCSSTNKSIYEYFL